MDEITWEYLFFGQVKNSWRLVKGKHGHVAEIQTWLKISLMFYEMPSKNSKWRQGGSKSDIIDIE